MKRIIGITCAVIGGTAIVGGTIALIINKAKKRKKKLGIKNNKYKRECDYK